jgi:hypothetical protein
MDEGFASLHELAGAQEYDITALPYRGAKMILAYEGAFRQRLSRAQIGRKTMNTVYRNWTAVGREISDADFSVDAGRPISSLSEIILLGVHMRAKDPFHFPFLSLPREERSENSTFINHDGYMLSRDENGSLAKEAWEVVSHNKQKHGTHPEVKEVPVLEVVSGVFKRFPGVAKTFRHLKNHVAAKLAQLGMVACLLEKDSRGHLKGMDLQILNLITGGLRSLTTQGAYRTATQGAAIESDLAAQLRAKFGDGGIV